MLIYDKLIIIHNDFRNSKLLRIEFVLNMSSSSSFIVGFGKSLYEINLLSDTSIEKLKKKLESTTGIPSQNQELTPADINSSGKYFVLKIVESNGNATKTEDQIDEEDDIPSSFYQKFLVEGELRSINEAGLIVFVQCVEYKNCNLYGKIGAQAHGYVCENNITNAKIKCASCGGKGEIKEFGFNQCKWDITTSIPNFDNIMKGGKHEMFLYQ